MDDGTRAVLPLDPEMIQVGDAIRQGPQRRSLAQSTVRPVRNCRSPRTPAVQGHPAGIGAKMEAFGMLNGITAAFALQEQADHGLQARNLACLALTSGKHPCLAAFLSPQAQLPSPEELAGRYTDLIARILQVCSALPSQASYRRSGETAIMTQEPAIALDHLAVGRLVRRDRGEGAFLAH